MIHRGDPLRSPQVRSKISFIRTLLDINDASFHWYFLCWLMALVLNWLYNNWLTDSGISTRVVFFFMATSGIIKLLYHPSEVLRWLAQTHQDLKGGKLLVRLIAVGIIRLQGLIEFFQRIILQGESLPQRLPLLSWYGFFYFFLGYLGLLLLRQVAPQWMASQNLVDPDAMLVVLIFLGLVAFFFDAHRVDVDDRPIGILLSSGERVVVTILGAGLAGMLILKGVLSWGWRGVGLEIAVVGLFCSLVWKLTAKDKYEDQF